MFINFTKTHLPLKSLRKRNTLQLHAIGCFHHVCFSLVSTPLVLVLYVVEFQGLWESLVFDCDIKEKVNRYTAILKIYFVNLSATSICQNYITVF